jgi:succinate dehydrogenase (ubiquinone) membrane anchor subunit
MASRSGPAALRQLQLLAASKQTFNSRTFSTRAALSHPSLRCERSPSPILSSAPRFAPFSTSSQKKILPPGPQVIDGGVNDPAPVPHASPIHGSYHWTFERLIALGLIPLTIAPFAGGSLNPTLDAVFVSALIVHSHIGFQ